ncbi:MAG: YqjD family protein [Candidatus Brocadiia bacterium]
MEHTAKVEAQELREKMGALKDDFTDVARTAKDRAVKGTTEWVKDHPFASMGIAAGVGFVIGILLGRKAA